MRLPAWTVLIALAPLAAAAQNLPPAPPRMPADESPTQFACTVEKLLKGERCAWEYEGAAAAPSPSVAAENSRKAAAIARGCAEAATHADASHPDAALLKGCEAEIAKLSFEPRCTLEGRLPLADADGRLATAARACVDALLRVVTRTRVAAAPETPSAAPAHDSPPASPPAKKARPKASPQTLKI